MLNNIYLLKYLHTILLLLKGSSSHYLQRSISLTIKKIVVGNIYRLCLFPISTKNFNKALSPIEPCMSRGILVLRKQKNHLSYTCLKSPTPANVFSFKKYRNLYNQIIRCVKKIYFEKQLKENQKKLAENMANSFLCDSQRQQKKN